MKRRHRERDEYDGRMQDDYQEPGHAYDREEGEIEDAYSKPMGIYFVTESHISFVCSI